MDIIKVTSLFRENYYSNARAVVNQGGTGSGKTFAICQVLFCIACSAGNQIITVVGQDMPNLKSGALRDALTIYRSSHSLKTMVKKFYKTESLFSFHNESIIEFKSYGNAQDAKSGKRDYLFVNEANGVSWEIYNELALRTRKRIYIDFNPNTAFWVHDNLLCTEGVQLIISDHRHNPYLPQEARKQIEALKKADTELWRVYARGLTGQVKGLVFNNWRFCDEIPQDARLLAAGLDFGFTNDQTGCVLVYKQSGELWIDEILYEHGLTNPDISQKLNSAGISKHVEIIADSAEPKSIEELRQMGWFINPAKKGADSVKNSIDILRRYQLNITRKSKNLHTELMHYKWKTDQSGKPQNAPVDTFNHLIDPIRYIALNKLAERRNGPLKSRMPAAERQSFPTIAKDLLI